MNLLSKTPIKKCCGTIHTSNILPVFKQLLPLISMLFFSVKGVSQTTIFSQNFSSSTSVSSYVSVTPNSGQFDGITTLGTSISGGALRFTRSLGTTSFTRSTNFSPVPTALAYSFSMNISSAGGTQNTAATFQVGSGYSTLTNGVESNANTYAQLGIDFRGGGAQFRLRDINSGTTGNNYNTGSAYTITWAMNNSGSTLSYTAPDGTTETVANDKMDVWVGTTKEFNDVTVQTAAGTLTDLKFAFTASSGNIDIDNINIYSINPFITAQPVPVTTCAGTSASFSVTAIGTSMSYQWKKAGVALSNGGSISGATTSTLTINPVNTTDAATDYTVEVTSSGGYTAISNNTALTVNALPTITTSSAAANVCNSASAQNSSLNYTATTNSPVNYSIAWDPTAIGAGLVNQGSTALPASPISIPIAAGVAASTYNGTLTVTNASSCSSTGSAFTVTINPLPTITGTLTVCTGSTTTLTGSGTPAASNPWVSATTSVATVNSSGVVTGVAAGTSVITYTNNNGCTKTATVTVSAAAITGTLNVCVGSTTTLAGSGTPAASNPWVSATTSVATVNTTGIVTGVAAGTSIITYTNNIGCSTTATVTVNSLPTITGTLTVCAASTITLTGSGTPAASNPWVSATTSVATVNSSGVVTGVAAGTSVITYTNNNGCSKTATVTVNAQPTITGTLAVCSGLTTTLTGSGTPAASNPWISATTSVATVNTTGVVTGVTAGTSVITYTNNNGCSKTATVTVNAQPTITGTLAVCSGSTTALTGSGTPAASNPWVSASTSVATVNTTGVVTGVAPGTSVITYTNNNGCSNTATVTDNALPTITGTLTVCTGSSSTLTGSGTAAASNPWVSATSSVATINTTGVVTGIAAGTSVITYTNNNGCSNTATITVNATPSASGINICIGGSGSVASSTSCPGGGTASSGPNNAGTGANDASVGTGAWSTPGNITATGTPYATQNLASGATSNYLKASNYGFAIPAGATINGITVAIRRQVATTTSMFDNIVKLVKAGSVTGSNLASGTAWPNTFGVATYGSTSNLWGTTWTAADINASNFGVVISATSGSGSTRQLDIDYIQVTVTYTTTGTLNWYTVSSGGSSIGSGTPFNPVGVAGSGLANTNTAGTTTYYAECALIPGCRAAANFVIDPSPTISNSAAASDVCFSTTAQNSTLSYSATTGTPTLYAVTWDAAALSAGLVNLASTAITTSPLTIPIAANTAAGTYTGTLTVTNATGCTSSGSAFTITINPSPSITSSAAAFNRCFSSSYQNGLLSYTATSGSPTHYTMTWDAAALTAGLVNVGSTSLTSSPIFFPLPGGTASGTYNGILTVFASNGCSSANAFTQLIGVSPTITASSTSATRCFNSSAQTTSLSFSATTGSPTLYSITWDAAAQAAGLVNVGLTPMPASPITIPVAAGVAVGTYNGTVKVMTGIGCQSSGSAFTFTIISAAGPVMTSASTASICSGSTVSIPLTSDIPSTYTWIATDNTSVTGESITTQTTSTLSNTLTVTSGSSQAVNYTVTPTSSGGCIGTPQAVTVTVNALPSITASASTAARCFSATSQTTTLSYSATTNSPNRYSITWNAAALAAGFVNVSNAVLPVTQITISIPAGTASNTYTGSLTVNNSVTGCTSSANSFTLTIGAAPSITTQPTNQTVCSGSSVSFTLTASGSGLTYQWRKGTTNLCNCGTASGVTTSTLTINPAVVGDASTDYNCVVTKSGCTSITSDYVSLTVNTSSVAPTGQPKDLVFPTVGITSVLGSYTASSDATRYLIIRKTTNVAPTNPANGTTYTQGTSALTGYIEYAGPGINFLSNGLSPGTTYYYWVYGYNVSSCGTSPLYLTTSPLTGSVTTATNIACGTVTTLYWGGKGSALTGATSGTDFNTAANWSTSGSSYVASPAVPSQCNNASMALTSSANITLSTSTEVYNLNFTIAGNNNVAKLSTENNLLNVYGDAAIEVISGNNNTAIYIGESSAGAGIIDFKANFKLGETYFASVFPTSFLVGNINSKIIFRGDVLLGRTARINLPSSSSYPPSYPLATPGTGTTPGTIEFDGSGLQQVLWNNNVWYDCFYNIVIGNQNKPYVKHVTGTYTPDNILNDFTINDGCTVDIGTSQWIREQQGGTFTMSGTAKLILGNNLSVRSSASTGVRVTGSNFPGGFSTMDISPASTIEYNGGTAITQTVYGTPSVGALTYGNLIVSNGDGTGTANKISTSIINAAGTITVSDKTTMTPGAGIVSASDMYVNNGGRLTCGTQIVSGDGSFNLQDGGTLSMASTAGITMSAASGNIQTGSRNFGTGANYIYNASTAQATGDALPTTVNNLTISNTAGVTMYAAAANYTVAGILNLTSGALAINGNTLTINSLQRSSGTLTGSATSSVAINGTSVPLFFTSGGRILKNLSLNSSASADLQTPLDITAGSSAGTLSVASGATLNTYDNLTLKSDANGTARVAEIPVDGSGNALGNVTGNVQIERYIPAKRGWRMLALPVNATGAPTINDALQEGVVNTDLVYANNQNPNPGFGIHISGSSPSLGFDATPLNNPSMMKFTRSSGAWSGIANTLTTTVRDYEGYMVFVRGNRSVNLSLNTSAALSNTVLRVLGNLRMGRQTISLTGGTGTYSVVGNPFVSTIDLRNMSTTGAASSSTFVMWDPNLTGTFGVGAYQYFTQVGGPGSNYTVFPGGGSYGSSGTVNNFVQAGQAFMIQNSGAGSVIINENTKVASSTSTVFRPMPANTVGRISTLLSSVETDSTTTLLDGALVLYGNDFSDNTDLEDAKKLFNNSENFGINKDASVYQIEKRQTINDTDTILYNIKTMKVKNYQLAVDVYNIDAAGMIAYLKDKYSNTETILNMNSTTVYPFSVTADANTKAPDRFRIYFKQVSVLPVTFTSLTAFRKNNGIKVEWKVENEMNINRYEIEKSEDGINFSKKHTISNVSNNNSNNTYQWTDEQPAAGINYFRIKSIDNNGRSKYTNIAKVFFGKDATGITVFPNPVTEGKINIYFTEQQPGNYTARLFNSNGQLMKSMRIQQAVNSGSAVITLDNTITHGNYILEIIKPDNTTEHINILY